VTPFNGVLDGEAAAIAGPYPYAFDTNQTGSVTAAGASPRVDRLDVQVDDPAESDGSSVPTVRVLYTVGTPGLAAAPARSHRLAYINVPASGGGSPTVTWNAEVTASAGGIAAVTVSGTYPTTPFTGQYVDDPALGLLRYNGSAWVGSGGESVADISSFGTGWAATNTTNHKPRVRRIGDQVFLYGAVTVSAGAVGATMLTVPAAFQPPSGTVRFIGSGTPSTGNTSSYQINSGVVGLAAGYGGSGGLAVGIVHPLYFSWWMD
jgi:hypothetical protein